jgi:hypothetical protein
MKQASPYPAIQQVKNATNASDASNHNVPNVQSCVLDFICLLLLSTSGCANIHTRDMSSQACTHLRPALCAAQVSTGLYLAIFLFSILLEEKNQNQRSTTRL